MIRIGVTYKSYSGGGLSLIIGIYHIFLQLFNYSVTTKRNEGWKPRQLYRTERGHPPYPDSE